MAGAHDPHACARCRALLPLAVKVCGCGRPYTAAGWARLPRVGVQDDGVERLELRNCLCGSTICVVLGPSLIGREL
jgi:hypothetical protein